MRYKLIALSLGLMGTTLFASPARAQGHGGRVFARAGRATATFSRGRAVGRGFVRMRHERRALVSSGFAPNYYPYYYPYYYSDYSPYYDSEGEIGEAPPAPIRAQTAAASPANPSEPPESLVMELRGDHWVRLTNHGSMEISGESDEPQSGRSNGPEQAPSELPPAVLVFRDGHQEEVAKYTIVGTSISIKTDYWNTGSWTRKVPIAELDVPATRQVNQKQGTKFSLPSRPGEVIVR